MRDTITADSLTVDLDSWSTHLRSIHRAPRTVNVSPDAVGFLNASRPGYSGDARTNGPRGRELSVTTALIGYMASHTSALPLRWVVLELWKRPFGWPAVGEGETRMIRRSGLDSRDALLRSSHGARRPAR